MVAETTVVSEMGARSVSYTHLDVYKRQLLIAAVALAVIPLAVWLLRDYPEDRGVLPYGADPASYVAPPRATGGAMPVSYTHLDVYKRQEDWREWVHAKSLKTQSA